MLCRQSKRCERHKNEKQNNFFMGYFNPHFIKHKINTCSMMNFFIMCLCLKYNRVGIYCSNNVKKKEFFLKKLSSILNYNL